MADVTTTPKPVRYRLKKGTALKIVGCPLEITNANVNTPAVLTIIANEGKRTGRDYFKLCLEKV